MIRLKPMILPPSPGVRLRALAWSVCGLTVAVALTSVVVAIADPSSAGPADLGPSGPTAHDRPTDGNRPFAVLAAVVFSTFAVVGGLVASRRPRNPIGWLFGAASLVWMLGVFGNQVYWLLAFGDPHPPAAADLVMWFGNWAVILPIVLLFTFVPLLFPTGAPPGPRWRAVGWTAAVAGGLLTLSTALTPGPLVATDSPWVDNPVGVEGLGFATLAEVFTWFSGASALAAIASLVVRYRRSRGIERLQLRWVATAACLLVAMAVAGDVAAGWLGEGTAWGSLLLGLMAVSAAVAVAMLRYRLYDIDVVINRALVYGALTATLAGSYLGVVLLLQPVLNGVTGDSGLAVAASTLAVAALFRPARSRIQELVDRRFYRRKYDAQLTLANFSAQMRDEVTLELLAAELRGVVLDTMQPAHVSLWLREPGE